MNNIWILVRDFSKLYDHRILHAMRSHVTLAILCAGLAACSEPEPLPLTSFLITEIKAYDLGNNGNSSDIRVDFAVQNNLHVDEYRIMVVPSNVRSAFDVSLASTMEPASYVDLDPESFELEYSVARLTSELLDVNGSPIQNELEYVVAILVKGVGDLQLSEFSRPFTLIEQGIYSGRYFLGFDDQPCTRSDGSMTSPGTTPPDGTYYVDLTGDSNTYSGILRCDTCDPGLTTWGVLSLTIEGTEIPEFRQDWAGAPCFSILCVDNPGCPWTSAGQGTVDDEVVFTVSSIGATMSTDPVCDLSDCASTTTFIRQT